MVKLIDTSGSDENADWIKQVGDYQSRDLEIHKLLEAGTREKHLPGQHDQSTHGSWAKGAASRKPRPIEEADQPILPGFEDRNAPALARAAAKRQKLMDALAPYEEDLIRTEQKRLKRAEELFSKSYASKDDAEYKKADAEYRDAVIAVKYQRAKAIADLATDTPAEITVGFGGWDRPNNYNFNEETDAKLFSREEMDYLKNGPIALTAKMAPALDGADITFYPARGRPFYDLDSASIWANHIDKDNAYSKSYALKQISHEMGHWIEQHVPGARQLANAFLNKRTKGTETRIDPMTQELFRPDSFLDEYMGKIYAHGGTEIISTGLAYLVQHPYALAAADPEMFDLVLAIVQRTVDNE